MQYSRCAFICMILESLTFQLSSEFFVMFVVHWTSASNFMLLLLVLWLLILMLIGLAALQLDVLLLVIVFFWVIIFYHGLLNDNILSLDRVPKLSIEVLQMQFLKLPGFVIFFVSFIHHYLLPPLSIVTMLALFI